MTLTECPSMTIYRPGSASAGGDPGRAVVWVHGDHDAAMKSALSLTLGDASRIYGGDLVVDLSCVRFMDASIVGALVAARNRLRDASRELTVRSPSPRARRLLELCGLEGLIDAPAAVTHPAGPVAALGTWVAVAPKDPPLDPPDRLVAEPAARSLASALGSPSTAGT